jgi:hypothetical protein
MRATPALIQEFERVWGRKPMLADAPIPSRMADYQDKFLREQSPRTKSAEWETRLPPLQSWDREIGGLLFGLVMGAFVLHVIGVW